jgi:hypothetical protein
MSAQLVIKDLTERGARFSLLEGDRILVAPPELLSDEDRARIRAHKDDIISILRTAAADEDASYAMPDPVPAILLLARHQLAAKVIEICFSNGIGLQVRDGRLTVITNGRAWPSLIAAIEQYAGAICLLLPGQVTGCDGTVSVIGAVRDSPPPPIEVTRYVTEPRPSWNGGPPDSEQKEAWITGALKAATHQGWTAEQLEHARERLTEIIEPGDQVESASNYKIIVRKRCGGGTVEVRRFDD